MIFDKHADLKYKYGNRKFWVIGYYVSTVGLNEQTVAKYIREQEKNGIALDKLSVKEYEDPFSRVVMTTHSLNSTTTKYLENGARILIIRSVTYV